MKKSVVILVALSIFLIGSALGQSFHKTSKNGKLFAQGSYGGVMYKNVKLNLSLKHLPKVQMSYYYNIDIYHLETKEWLQKFKFESSKKQTIKEFGFSPDNQFFYAMLNGKCTVWNIRSGRQVKTLNNADGFVFSNFDDYFITRKTSSISNFSQLVTYDNYTGDPIQSYNIPGYVKSIEKLEISSDDRYLTAKADNSKLVLWQIGTRSALKRFTGDDIKFSNDGQRITILNNRNGNCYTYNLSDIWSATQYISTSKRITAIVKADVIAQKENGNEKVKYQTRKIDKYRLSLSPDGKYIAVPVTYGVGKKEIYVFQTKTDSLILKLDDYDLPLNNIWTSYEQIVVDKGNMKSSEFNLYNQQFTKTHNYEFRFDQNKKKIKIDKQIKNRNISINRNYVVMQSHNKLKPILMVKSTENSDEKIIIENVHFVDFSSDSKHLIIENAKGQLGFINTKNLNIMTSANDSISQQRSELPYSLTPDSMSVTRSEIKIVEDAETPIDFDYPFFRKVMPLDSLPDSAFVKLHLKTITTEEFETEIQVHLIDDNGVYYYGGSDAKWRHIWKELILKSGNNFKQIHNFEVTEAIGSEDTPSALAMVLDHSGSMGDYRALALQEAAQHFIDIKKVNDALTIVKYDSRTEVETPLSTNKKMLHNDLKINGLTGFGGATSMLDAVNRSVSVLKKAKNYERKTVIVLTDGYENSSYVSKGQMLKNSNKNHVNVFTVGFGQFIDENYLKAIAGYTNGTYYQIFNTSDFEWIFNDIYNKMRYYYTIKFKTDSIGDHSAFLSVKINDNIVDSIVSVFNNNLIDYTEIDSNLEFNTPVYNVTDDDDDDDDDEAESEIEKFVSFKTEKETITQKISEDFANINFPNIEFKTGTETIVNNTEHGINEVAEFMNKNNNFAISIHGHTDNTGDEIDNFILSQNRAISVKNLLIDKGIESNRISTTGFGESNSIANNETKAGKAQNRRVEFILDLEGYTPVYTTAVDSDNEEIAYNTTSINKTAENNVGIYPNPTNGEIFIDISQDTEIHNLLSITITDIAGKIIMHTSDINSEILQLNITNRPKGTYFVRLKFENTVIIKKIELI